MKTNSLKKAALLSVALAAAGIGTSSAGLLDTSIFAAADIDVSGGLSTTEFNTTLQSGLSVRAQTKAFRKADYNRDAAIQVNEFLIYRGIIQPENKIQVAFYQSDESLGGTLNWDEFVTTYGSTSYVNIRRNFLRADIDANGQITLEEYDSFRRGQTPRNTDTIYFLADFDGNAQVTLTEYGYFFGQNASETKMQNKFTRLDVNADGYLATSEWNPGVRNN